MESFYFGIMLSYKNGEIIAKFPDSRERVFSIGTMLQELLSDEGMYILKQKPQNLLRLFPYNAEPVRDNLVCEAAGFMYGGAEDEDDFPVVSEMLRSCFANAVCIALLDDTSFENIGSFTAKCFSIYEGYIAMLEAILCLLVDFGLNIGEKVPPDYSENFSEVWDDFSENVVAIRSNPKSEYIITDPISLIAYEYVFLTKKGKTIKRCCNCNRFFIPEGRIDTKYCLEKDPNNSNKTCREVGPYRARSNRIEADSEARRFHNLYSNYSNKIIRARKNGDFKRAEKMEKERKTLSYSMTAL